MPDSNDRDLPVRFPFQDDDSSEDDLAVPMRLTDLSPPDDTPVPIRTLDLFDEEDNSDHDEHVSTHMGPGRRISGGIPMSRIGDFRALHGNMLQRATDTITAIADRLINQIDPPSNQASTYVDPVAPPTSHQQPFAEPEEPPYPNQPSDWEPHHEYFLWSCRGTVQVITDHLQAVFQFFPPLLASFVRAKLINNASKQFEFLKKYLPGETHSMLRAEARIVLCESGLTDPQILEGSQAIEIPQYSPRDWRYSKPVIPGGRPHFESWVLVHDCHLLLFLGSHPQVFLRQCRHLFNCQPTDHFLSVRMAQLPFLGLTVNDLNHEMLALKLYGSQQAGGGTTDGISF